MEQPLRPKRSFSLVVLSVVVLAACVFLISAAISMFTVTWDPCSLIGGVIVLLFPAVLAIQQYRGTFRYESKAALISSVLLFIVGALALVAFAMTLGEMIVEDVRIPWISLILPMLAIGVVGGVSAWINLSWSRHLKRSATADEQGVDRTQFSMRELLIAVAAIAYEFTIDEKGFVEWVESGIGSLESDAANVSVQPIAVPYSIRRYCGLTSYLAGPDSITITNGLCYDWSKEDRGVYAAFDRTTNRAYYYAHFH